MFELGLSELIFGSMLALFVVFVALPMVGVVIVLGRMTRAGTQFALLRRRLGMSRSLGWAVGVAMLGGFALPYVLGAPPGEGEGELPFVLAGLLYAAGVFVLGWAVARRDHYRLVRETPTTDTGGPHQPGTLVELEATAAPADEPATGPVTGDPCLAYRYRVDERRWMGRYRNWVPMDHGRGGAAFEVDDGSGPTLVEPEGARLELESVETVRVDGDEDPPAHLERLAETVDDLDEDGPVRYREWRLEPGERAYVLGEAVDRPSADHLGQTAVADGDAPFVVADRGEDARKRRLRLLVTYGGPGGAVAAVAGMGLMLQMAGVF